MWPGCCEDTEEVEPIQDSVPLTIMEVWVLQLAVVMVYLNRLTHFCGCDIILYLEGPRGLHASVVSLCISCQHW